MGVLGEVHLQVEGQVEILTRICLDSASATSSSLHFDNNPAKVSLPDVCVL